MEENPYRAPEAERLVDIEEVTPFFVVKPSKLLLMQVMTLGLYGVYWFYQQWKHVRVTTGEKLWPVPRAIFALFFVHKLFARVDDEREDRNLAASWDHRWLATLYVIASVASHILDRLSWREVGSPWTDMGSLLPVFVHALVMYKAQPVINLVCGDPEATANRSVTGANVVWLIIGGLLWALVLFGLVVYFLPE